MNPSPPDGLVENLRRLDPELRLRWGQHQHKWIIGVRVGERQPSRIAERPNPLGQSPRALDWFALWNEGLMYVTALAHPIAYPWEFIAAHLKHLSLEAHHAKDALIERLDAAEREEEASIKRNFAVGNEAAAKQLYDDWGWEQKRKISAFVPGENPHLEKRDGFSVVDRRGRA